MRLSIGRLVLVVALGAGVALPASAHEAVGRRAPGPRVVVTSTDIEVFGPLRFVRGTAVLEKDGERMLAALARTLDGNPSLKRLEVRAYGDVERPDLALASLRAQVVRAALVARGVAETRLRAVGVAAVPRGRRGAVDIVIVERTP